MRNAVRYQQQWPGQSMLEDEIKQVFGRFFQAGDGQDESSVVTSQWAPLVDIAVMITIPKRRRPSRAGFKWTTTRGTTAARGSELIRWRASATRVHTRTR
ncbi:MAG: hypothetical protein M3485_04715 [Pseudomonadota bacterium]|nr:hypothetical protein [Pseudomonadota bacterium]